MRSVPPWIVGSSALSGPPPRSTPSCARMLKPRSFGFVWSFRRSLSPASGCPPAGGSVVVVVVVMTLVVVTGSVDVVVSPTVPPFSTTTALRRLLAEQQSSTCVTTTRFTSPDTTSDDRSAVPEPPKRSRVEQNEAREAHHPEERPSGRTEMPLRLVQPDDARVSHLGPPAHPLDVAATRGDEIAGPV